MKQVNFTHPGGFPLEQETLERLQTAYRSELFGALKGHLSIKTNKNYTITPATNNKKGWAIIHQEEKDPKDETAVKILQGILYPIEKGTPTQFLKTTKTGTNLTYGTGVLQTAYFDYDAKYITPDEYTNRPAFPSMTDALTVYYYDLNDFEIVKDIEAIETIIQAIKTNIVAIEANIDGVEANIDKIEADISSNYLPLKGSKAMEGDLNLGSYQLSKLDIKETPTANVRVTDFRLGSNLGRAIVNDSTNLSLNYGSDWENTNIGGKVYLNNISSSNSTGSLLVVDSSNQVTKSNTLLESLIKRITDLEEKPATAVPKGMIAIWGKPAPFPEGWEEYVPLRGRMPVGFDSTQLEFNNWTVRDGGSKNKKLTIDELPKISPINGTALKKGGTWGGNSGLTVGDHANGDYVGGELIKPFGGDMPFSILNPYRVVHFIEYTGNITPPVDTIAPTSPTILTVSKIGTKSLTLTWTASTDNVGVTNYLVYKDNSNTPLAELGKEVLTYNVTGLSANTSYSFQVRAKDAAGNLSVPATVTTATLAADSTPPTLPSFFSCVHNGQGYILLEWAQSQDDDSPIDYELSRSAFGSLFTVLKKNPNTYYSEQVSSNGTYTYRVRAIDPSGNASAYKEASITISSL
ncbi:fibronectin type III domain-containing protein [Flavobacterium sp. SLB02]|uniref:fibronectin type III domain-containing protein n=1 Tax=Flavobacterium sp. SLB02 TaxID=2665645 RepID=UPI0012A8BDD8|nr:fibronectin type III domain-containing protein [Flavobacterium sp. SLB02]QGK72778.1 hypothetical protein GIY83_01440 [Flavobacterium sp. SLB02]